ncbi:hypothetical protein AAG570_003170 [Ranatra chinensis]|uniref:Coiled-coil domain-containing protein 186 n=1 Tax=Ranatra chinensis TaxID=642074 RepID=A0ABD0Y746_9HEMI
MVVAGEDSLQQEGGGGEVMNMGVERQQQAGQVITLANGVVTHSNFVDDLTIKDLLNESLDCFQDLQSQSLLETKSEIKMEASEHKFGSSEVREPNPPGTQVCTNGGGAESGFSSETLSDQVEGLPKDMVEFDGATANGECLLTPEEPTSTKEISENCQTDKHVTDVYPSLDSQNVKLSSLESASQNHHDDNPPLPRAKSDSVNNLVCSDGCSSSRQEYEGSGDESRRHHISNYRRKKAAALTSAIVKKVILSAEERKLMLVNGLNIKGMISTDLKLGDNLPSRVGDTSGNDNGDAKSSFSEGDLPLVSESLAEEEESNPEGTLRKMASYESLIGSVGGYYPSGGSPSEFFDPTISKAFRPRAPLKNEASDDRNSENLDTPSFRKIGSYESLICSFVGNSKELLSQVEAPKSPKDTKSSDKFETSSDRMQSDKRSIQRVESLESLIDDFMCLDAQLGNSPSKTRLHSDKEDNTLHSSQDIRNDGQILSRTDTPESPPKDEVQDVESVQRLDGNEKLPGCDNSPIDKSSQDDQSGSDADSKKDSGFEDVSLQLDTDGCVCVPEVEEINTQTRRRIEKTISETSVKISETVTETSVRITETPLQSSPDATIRSSMSSPAGTLTPFEPQVSVQSCSSGEAVDGEEGNQPTTSHHDCTSSPGYQAVTKELENSRNLTAQLKETIESLKSQISLEKSQAERISLLEQRIAQQERELQLSRQEHDLDVRTIATLRKEMESKTETLRKQYESEHKDKVSMVMKYAISEKERIDAKKEIDNVEKRLKDQVKEVENMSAKLKNMTTEKSRITLLFEQKMSELTLANREIEKLKEELNSREIKIKWVQNKMKSEMEIHKECPEKIEALMTRVRNLEDELATALKTVQNFEKGQEESESRKALELKLKEEHSKLILEKHEHSEKEAKLKLLQNKNQVLIEENNNLSLKVQNLEQERFDFEQKLTSAREDVRAYCNTVAELQGRLATLDTLGAQLLQERERVETTTSELERLRKSNKELMNDMASCRNREAEMLTFTQKLTTKNVQLQSEFSAVETKASTLEREYQCAEDTIANLRNRLKVVEKELKEEQSKRAEECRLLARQVAEKTNKSEGLEAALDDCKGEISVLKNKHAATVRIGSGLSQGSIWGPDGVVVSVCDYHAEGPGLDSVRGQSWLKSRLAPRPLGV